MKSNKEKYQVIFENIISSGEKNESKVITYSNLNNAKKTYQEGMDSKCWERGMLRKYTDLKNGTLISGFSYEDLHHIYLSEDDGKPFTKQILSKNDIEPEE